VEGGSPEMPQNASQMEVASTAGKGPPIKQMAKV